MATPPNEASIQPTSSLISTRDREVLRALAGRVSELATRRQEQEKVALWKEHNSLKLGRPLVFCDPENGWHEIIRSGDLLCEGELARGWEWALRREVFWGQEMRDDRVCTGIFSVGYSHRETGWGLYERRIGGESGGAYTWDPPLKNLDDLSELRFPKITVDHTATDRMFSCAQEVFQGLLTVRIHQTWLWTVGLTQTLIFLRGLEQVMLDMLDNPAGLHRLMSFMRDGTMARLEFLESEGLLHLNNGGEYVGSGGFGWTDELPAPGYDGQVRTKDMWGLAESQETVGVSPAMFGEFIFPYQLPLMERFGLTCYGCCEPVHQRWDYLKQVPNLRRVSVSPWCDVRDMAEKTTGGYILSIKPNPAHLATASLDEDVIRAELRSKLLAARGCPVELIMKDCHTIGGNPSHVIRWVEIAREESERIQ